MTILVWIKPCQCIDNLHPWSGILLFILMNHASECGRSFLVWLKWQVWLKWKKYSKYIIRVSIGSDDGLLLIRQQAIFQISNDTALRCTYAHIRYQRLKWWREIPGLTIGLVSDDQPFMAGIFSTSWNSCPGLQTSPIKYFPLLVCLPYCILKELVQKWIPSISILRQGRCLFLIQWLIMSQIPLIVSFYCSLIMREQ